jgi:hypothetical protein
MRPIITPRKSEWQPENGGEPATSGIEISASNHERKRADRLMQRAYAMYASGYREEALRLASVAAELEFSQLAVYKQGEERPSDFVEFLLAATGRTSDSSSIVNALPAPAAGIGSDRCSNKGDTKVAGAVLPAQATGLPLAARDLKPSPAGTPRFTRGDNDSLRAAANAGQIEVPMAKALRNADAGVVAAAGNGSNADESAKADESRAVVTADRVEEPESAPPSPNELASKPPETAPAVTDAAEIEPLVDAETPAASHSSSQLTIASLAGLLVGIAGMLGLAWWRRQERQHYAGGK